MGVGRLNIVTCTKTEERYLRYNKKIDKGREAADLGICKSFIVAGAQCILDLSFARVSFASAI